MVRKSRIYKPFTKKFYKSLDLRSWNLDAKGLFRKLDIDVYMGRGCKDRLSVEDAYDRYTDIRTTRRERN